MDHLIRKCHSGPQCHLLDGAKYSSSHRPWVELPANEQHLEIRICLIPYPAHSNEDNDAEFRLDFPYGVIMAVDEWHMPKMYHQYHAN